MLERRKEAEMLREASVVASSRKSISRPGSRVLEETNSMLFENKYNDDGDSIYNDTITVQFEIIKKTLQTIKVY